MRPTLSHPNAFRPFILAGALSALCTAACGGPTNENDKPKGTGNAGGSSATGGSAGTNGGSSTATTGGAGGTSAAGTGGTATTGGAGGSSGSTSGGNPGTGGTVPIVVTDCDDLPEVGEWEYIDPPEFAEPTNMEALSVIVTVQNQAVYASAGNKTNGGNGGTGVMKSTDCGATWNVISTGLNGDKLATGDTWAMLADPSNPDIIWTNNGYGNDPTIYKSTNGGVDFQALTPHPTWGVGSFVQDIAMEQTNPEHVAVSFHNNCPEPQTALCFSRTTDGGENWELFNGPASLGGWLEGAALTVLGPDSYVYFGTGAWFTSDLGENWEKVIDAGFNGSYAGTTTIDPSGVIYTGGVGTVQKSDSDPLGSAWTSIPNSPSVTVMVNDGLNLIGSHGGFTDKPMWIAPLDDLTTWTSMPSATMERGANQMAYDSVHHIVYAVNWAGGLWRLVSR